MNLEKAYKEAAAAAADPGAPLPDPESAGEHADLVSLLRDLILENRTLREEHRDTLAYIRGKVDQLLLTIGTIPLKPEELDDRTLLQLDPIGVVADAFVQVLEHLRATNERLKQTRNQLAAVFEAVGAGIMVLDRDLRIQACNKRFRRMFLPSTDSDPRGQFCRDVICLDSTPTSRCSFRKMLDTGHSVQFHEWPYKDRYLNIVASPIRDRDGMITSGVMLYQDVTEQRRDKASLMEEKERLAITLRSIAEGVITINIDDRITMMNGVAEELTGWRQEEAIGQPAGEIFWIVDQEQRNRDLNLSRVILQQMERIDRTVPAVLISRDGVEHLVNASAAPIRDAGDVVIGVVIVFRDITGERRLEKEIMNARRLESLGTLAGGIAHDFNNLLTGILGNISLARMVAGGADKRLADYLLSAEQACLRTKNLTQQLLTFAKGGTPILKVMSIAELLRETSKFVLRGSNVSCRFDIDDNLWPAEVDEGQIGQVVNNLVINASQAMPQGGMITLQADNVILGNQNSFAFPKGKYLKISVIDTGTGIPEGFLDKIFDPYFTTKQSGSGLGLASCYTIVKKHGGLITVDSRLGLGSTFSVFLPASVTEHHLLEKKGDEPEALPPRQAEKILVMDDEKVILDFARKLSEHLGYKVSVAGDGREAVDFYRQALDAGEPFDVVIMDLTVPGGMGGREALKLLREIDPGVRAIVSSGYSTDDAMASHLEHGFLGVVPKPYNAEVLVKEINRVMQMKGPARE